MKIINNKKAFTMVELIFVIVIIGLLGAVAVPQFMKTTGSAKVNAELATMDNLSSSLEWSKLYVSGKLSNLHFSDEDEAVDLIADRKTAYRKANTESSLFTQVSASGGKGMRIVAMQNLDQTSGDDVLILKGKASDTISGLDYPSISDSGTTRDLVGKPDRNDIWVFNGKSSSITIDIDGIDTTTDDRFKISAYSVLLVDIEGTNDTTSTILETIKINDVATSVTAI